MDGESLRYSFITDGYAEGKIDSKSLREYVDEDLSDDKYELVLRYLSRIIDEALSTNSPDLLNLLEIVDEVADNFNEHLSLYTKVVRSDDDTLIRDVIEMYRIHHIDDLYYGGMDKQDVPISFLEAAEHNEEQLDRVARIVYKLQDWILSYYIRHNDRPSWKILHALSKYTDFESERLDLACELECNYDDEETVSKKMGILTYLQQSDV